MQTNQGLNGIQDLLSQDLCGCKHDQCFWLMYSGSWDLPDCRDGAVLWPPLPVFNSMNNLLTAPLVSSYIRTARTENEAIFDMGKGKNRVDQC